MGLFSSKSKTTVGTSVSRVVEDSVISSSVKTGLVTSIIASDNQLVENLLENIIASIGTTAQRMYNYGKTSYYYGLPSSTILSSSSGKPIVKAKIEALIGKTITVDYYHFGPINNLHVGWQILCDTYGYKSATNEISVLSVQEGFTVYLNDMLVVVKEALLEERNDGSLNQWGIAANSGFTPFRDTDTARIGTPFAVDAAAVGDYLRVSYVWNVPTVFIITPETTEITYEDTYVDVPAVYEIVNGVSVEKTPATTKLVVITITTVIPAVTETIDVLHNSMVDIPITGFDEEADYFQVRYSVYGQSDDFWTYKFGSNVHPNIEAIFTTESTQLGSYFPFAYFRLGKTSMETLKGAPKYETTKKLLKYLDIDYPVVIDAINQNPDIADVEQAMMVFAVPSNSTKNVDQQYLFDFFDKLSNEIDPSGIEASPEGVVPDISIVIQDKEFKMALSCKAISKEAYNGTIAPKGKHTSSIETVNVVYYYLSTPVSEYDHSFFGNTTVEAPVLTSWTVPLKTHIYRRQLDDWYYEEIQVYDLKMTYYVYGQYTTTGDADNLAILLIPLDYSITKDYKFLEREELYTRSMHYVFNSRIVTKVKWYQQGIFKVFMMVAAIAFTIFSGGADGGSLYSLVAAGTMTMEAAIVVIAMNLLVTAVVGVALKLFVKAVGTKIAFILMIVAAIAGAYLVISSGSLAGSPWASDLLSLSNGLSSGINDVFVDNIKDLMGEANNFKLFADSKMELLEDSKKLLTQDVRLNPFVIFGETSEAFYDRTIHSGNIGVLSLASIGNYVGSALTLPTVTRSLQENLYV